MAVAQPPAPLSTKVEVVSAPEQFLTPVQAYAAIVATGAYKVRPHSVPAWGRGMTKGWGVAAVVPA